MANNNSLIVINKEQAKKLGLKRYYTGRPCIKGHICQRYLCGVCVECVHSRNRDYYKNNPGDRAKRENSFKLKNPIKSLLNGAKNTAKLRNLEFTIKVDDFPLGIPEKCECCNIKLIVKPVGFNKDKKYKVSIDTPTFDRVDNSKGYIPGNVFIICWGCNELKRNGTAEQHRRIADWIDSKLK